MRCDELNFLCTVFLKAIFKYQKATGERVMHYRLVESYRIDDQVRHETILNLGALEELPDIEQKRVLGQRINELMRQSVTGKTNLFVQRDGLTERLAQKFFQEIKNKQRIDNIQDKEYHVIDTQTIKNKEVKEAGIEWLCYQALEQLQIRRLFEQKQWSEADILLALTHLISRASYPASELKTSRWIKENSSVCEITGYPPELITKDKLYKISHQLYSIKDELEKHLSKTTNELFDLNDTIIIYDLTNTYYEGAMLSSKLAKFGRSKEKRNDARIVVLAVVVNVEGFLKYSQIFEGNLSDCDSLQHIIHELSMRTSWSGRKPIVVLDAGISTEENLQLLRNHQFDYLCVSRKGMCKYKVEPHTPTITITDNKEQPITLKKVKVEGSSDNFLLAESRGKALKEKSIYSRFTERFEQAMNQVKQGLDKKGGIKQHHKVWERIGRIKEKYQRVGKFYEINTTADANGKVTDISWTLKPIEKNEGRYLLRTTLNEQDEKMQWAIYNTIREIEATFRVLKTDLDLRPIYHKTDEASMAHLHLGLLAYQIVNTLRYQLKQKGMNYQWSEIVRIMNTQKMVTTTMVDQYEQNIVIRQCSEPTQKVSAIYQSLNYKEKPFSRKKFVVPQPDYIFKNNPDLQSFTKR